MSFILNFQHRIEAPDPDKQQAGDTVILLLIEEQECLAHGLDLYTSGHAIHWIVNKSWCRYAHALGWTFLPPDGCIFRKAALFLL
jgi:hypothetical protein